MGIRRRHDAPPPRLVSLANADKRSRQGGRWTADSQAAAEAALSLVVETLASGNMIHDLGYLESGLTFSFAQLVLCDEIVSWIKAYTKEFEVSDESLALDVIAELGAAGISLTPTIPLAISGSAGIQPTSNA